MTDRRTVLFIVIALASLAAVALIGTVVLLYAERATESIAIISGLAGTGMGALAALLVSTRSSEPPPDPGTTVSTSETSTVTTEAEAGPKP